MIIFLLVRWLILAGLFVLAVYFLNKWVRWINKQDEHKRKIKEFEENLSLDPFYDPLKKVHQNSQNSQNFIEELDDEL